MPISITEVLSPTTSISVGRTAYTINKNPSWEVLNKVNSYREKIKQREKYNNWLSEREAILFLQRDNVISEDWEKQLKEISKTIDNHKKMLYNNRDNEKMEKSLRKKLHGYNIMYADLYYAAHSLDHITLNGYLDQLADLFLLSLVVKPTPSFGRLEHINTELHKLSPTVRDIRALARGEPWRSHWAARKASGVRWRTLNQEQVSLILYSKMYDNVYEHLETPSERVINDDDMLDGWMLINREKQERERLTAELEAKNPKLKNATEVFLPAKNQEQIDSINSMNSDVAKTKKAGREQVIRQKGNVKDGDFAKRGLDVK